jgi:UDP-N-acetylmuramyl pentapeptide synthase
VHDERADDRERARAGRSGNRDARRRAHRFLSVSTDTRTLAGALFVALRERFDGHDCVAQASGALQR